MSFFLSLSLSSFFRLTPWNTEALWVHFFAQASKTQSRRHSVSSPHREGAWGLREQNKSRLRGYIGFLCKPRNISLFLSSLFFLLYFLIIRPRIIRFQSIIRPVSSLSLMPFILRVPLDPAGAGPWQRTQRYSCLVNCLLTIHFILWKSFLIVLALAKTRWIQWFQIGNY